MAQRDVWLPEGHWTDIFTGDEYDGGRTVKIVRWMDTIPVFAKEGGFLVTDGREITNNTDEPDILDVKSYNGSGSYILYEVNSSTEFRSEYRDGIQTVYIKTNRGNSRRINLHFPNVVNGDVTLYIDDKKMPCVIDTDGYISASFDLPERSEAKITVKPAPISRTDRRNRMLLYSMLRINGNHFRRSDLLKKLFEADDMSATYEIKYADFLTENEKCRLMEALYLSDEDEK